MLDILDHAGISHCKPSNTPVDTHSKLSADGVSVADPSPYRSLAGALQYLTFTRPDIAYAVQQVCLYMHDPREPHLSALKRILWYLQGTLDLGLHLHRTSPADLIVYTDADWAGCPDTRKSTSGYAVFLGDNLISRSSKRQPTVSRSSAEAEYRAVANGVTEACWLRQLLIELRCPLRRATVVYCDNIIAVYLSTTRFNISEPSILRSTCTSLENESPSVKSASYTFPLRPTILAGAQDGEEEE
ncbi:secreted RxLR effector protein 161-like [Miscanthus floridulus]|uniref:secreted RxLR effector protein 161-like n=1 Tax=Miscanthus floridulus TaxID=154761 RepID=UPI00345976AE